MPSFKRNLLILACLAVLGCGPEYEFVHTNYLVNGGGVENDSMVIFLEYIEDKWHTEGALGTGGNGYYKIREINLCLADNRAEKIYWKKKNIPDDNSNVHLNVIDSILYFFQKGKYIKKIAFFRLGNEEFQLREQFELKYKEISFVGEDRWIGTLGHRVRPWRNGLILVTKGKGENALLDTAAGTMELWEPTGEFEWLNECADAKWSRVGGLCLKDIPDTLGFVLLRNGVDTLAVRYMPYVAPRSNKLPYFSGNAIVSGGWVYLMNNQGQVSEKPLDVLLTSIGRFLDLNGNELVRYEKKFVN